MSSAPKIRYSYSPLLVGKDWATVMYQGSVDALLASTPHWKLKNGSWSGGSEFYTISQKEKHTTQSVDWLRIGNQWKGGLGRVGNLSTSIPPAGSSSASPPTSASAIGKFPSLNAIRDSPSTRVDFAAGWEKTRPGNPVVNLAQFIFELRDFPSVPGSLAARKLLKRLPPPKLKKGKPSFFKDWVSGPVEQIPWKLQAQLGFFSSLGSEYLNHVFGWVPFVGDLQKLYVLSQTIDNRLKQIARDNGQGIRRRAKVSNDVQTSSAQSSSTSGPFLGVVHTPPNWTTGGGVWTTTTKIETSSWFSARYRYYIPDVASGSWIPGARRALYGLTLTPSLVWELTPWSWLTDWFVNVGSVLSNLSENAVQNLVADYAFLMIHQKKTTTSTASGSWKRFVAGAGPTATAIPSGSYSLKSEYVLESKVRVLGSPYGLGVKIGDLSGYQLGVLAALGISQSKF